MVVDHCPEVDNSVWQRSLSQDKCIPLFITLTNIKQTSVTLHIPTYVWLGGTMVRALELQLTVCRSNSSHKVLVAYCLVYVYVIRRLTA